MLKSQGQNCGFQTEESLKSFDGFIFDIDGTLASTHDLIFASFNYVADKYLHRTFTNEEISSLFGPTEDVILKEWMKEKYEHAREDYFDFYSSQHNEMAEIFPGIVEVLKFIRSKKLPIGIYTGKGKDSSVITLRQIGVLDLFDIVITGDDVEEHKPSPEGIHKFVNHFTLDPERVLMIGDTAADVRAARDAGVKSALVLWDPYSKEKYSNVSADYIFYTVEELTQFLEKNTV